MRLLTALAVALLVNTPSLAGSITSEYTKLDFDRGCIWEQPASEEEAQMGGRSTCQGFGDYEVHFAEGDLRQFLAYGPATDPFAFSSGFAQWNSVNETIEWRLEHGKPFATIHRWFLDNINPDTGSVDPARRGQVLVVSTVASFSAPQGERHSCVVGYVDARANTNANELAREIADSRARVFRCGQDKPVFYGERGPYSGTPNAFYE